MSQPSSTLPRVGGSLFLQTVAIPLLLPVTQVVGLALGGGWAWLPVLYAFALVPALDLVVPLDTDPPPGRAQPDARWMFELAVHLWVPVQIVVMAATMARVSAAEVGGWTQAGWVVGLAMVTGGGGITVAHELMHRPDRRARGLAELLMTLVLYPHFCVEHILGHHRRVATEDDPASARLGESVWSFLPRTVLGGLRSAWGLEAERVHRLGLRGLSDRRWRHPIGVSGLVLLTALAFGAPGLVVLVGSSAVAVFLLEVVNYVEHYGLVRARRPDGRYERVRPAHSWNSAHRLTGWILFRLPRHSDHHYLAHRPYHELEHHEAAPQLPASYPAMMILALAPPLWRRIMDPRVEAWRGAAPA